MTEILDRVAAAMHAAHGILLPFRQCDAEYQHELRTQARAALRALRDLTPEMIEAARIKPDAGSFSTVSIWQAMIDKVLEA